MRGIGTCQRATSRQFYGANSRGDAGQTRWRRGAVAAALSGAARRDTEGRCDRALGCPRRARWRARWASRAIRCCWPTRSCSAKATRLAGTAQARTCPPNCPMHMTSVARRGRARPAAAHSHAPRLSQVAPPIGGRHVTWAAPAAAVAYDFRYGRPAFVDFPHVTWRRLLAAGAPAVLRRAISITGRRPDRPRCARRSPGYLQRARAASPQRRAGDRRRAARSRRLDLCRPRPARSRRPCAAWRSPTTRARAGVFFAAGARLVAAPVDADGIDVSALGASGPACDSPTSRRRISFRTGVLMSLAPPAGAARLGRAVGATSSRTTTTASTATAVGRSSRCRGWTAAGRVIYVGTFSKLLFPAAAPGLPGRPQPLVQPFAAPRRSPTPGRHARAARAGRLHRRRPLRAPHPALAHAQRRPAHAPC